MEQKQAMMQTAESFFFFLFELIFRLLQKTIPCSFHYKTWSLLQNDSLCHQGRRYDLPHVSEKAYEVIFILSTYENYYFLT